MRTLLLLIFVFISFFAVAQDSSDTYDEDVQYEESSEGSTDEGYQESSEEGVEYEQEVVHETVDPSRVSESKGYDREQINVKRFDKKKWEEIVDGEDFSEAAKKKKKSGADGKSGDASNQRLNEAENEDDEMDESGFSFGAPIGSPIITILFYVVVACLIGYILFLIIQNTSLKSNPVKKDKKDQDVAAAVEDIQELEIDRLLREALASGNYRLAIRICFLGLLKKLDQQQVIHWKKDKTNREYLSELLKNSYHYEEIRGLTHAYEEVWYGEHTFPVEQYQQIISSFKLVDQKINVSNTIESR